jgi:hypothetical protein
MEVKDEDTATDGVIYKDIGLPIPPPIQLN